MEVSTSKLTTVIKNNSQFYDILSKKYYLPDYNCRCITERINTGKLILFMDNASIHKTKDFMQKLKRYQNIMYNAPYTPQLNPIEFAFSKIKNTVRKENCKSEKELISAIYKAANQITERDATNYVAHSIDFLGDAVDEKDFY